MEFKITEAKMTVTGKPVRTRVYVFLEGESVLEDLVNRRSRPHNLYKKEILPALAEKFPLFPEKLSWSQKAGCACGCSPGFVAASGSSYGKEFFVTVKVSKCG